MLSLLTLEIVKSFVSSLYTAFTSLVHFKFVSILYPSVGITFVIFELFLSIKNFCVLVLFGSNPLVVLTVTSWKFFKKYNLQVVSAVNSGVKDHCSLFQEPVTSLVQVYLS